MLLQRLERPLRLSFLEGGGGGGEGAPGAPEVDPARVAHAATETVERDRCARCAVLVLCFSYVCAGLRCVGWTGQGHERG